jgi:integrase
MRRDLGRYATRRFSNANETRYQALQSPRRNYETPWGNALRTLKEAAARHGIPHVNRHSLRHMWSAWMKQEGVPLSELYIPSRLNHSERGSCDNQVRCERVP